MFLDFKLKKKFTLISEKTKYIYPKNKPVIYINKLRVVERVVKRTRDPLYRVLLIFIWHSRASSCARYRAWQRQTRTKNTLCLLHYRQTGTAIRKNVQRSKIVTSPSFKGNWKQDVAENWIMHQQLILKSFSELFSP